MKKIILLAGILFVSCHIQAQEVTPTQAIKERPELRTRNIDDVSPFEDDICGVWVSDLAYDNATPYLVVEIQKDDSLPQNYKAKILPYCTLAGKYGMYTGKPFNYAPKYNEKAKSFFAFSSSDSVYSDNSGRASFYFGNKKYRKGLDKDLASALTTSAGATGKSISSTYGAKSKEGAVAESTANLAIGLVTLFSSSKTTDMSIELKMQRLFAGCASIDLDINTYVAKTDTKEIENESDSLYIQIYKLYPEDKILFAANGNELFGYRTFTQDENQNTEEYAQLQALKNRSDFNKQAYKKLSKKIADYCSAKAKENPDYENWAEECDARFEYAAKGLFNRRFTNRFGSFDGWTEPFGFRDIMDEYICNMNGFGKCTLKDGTTYIGEWKNNRFSGKGLLHKGAISYDGEFVNNAFEGTGTLTDANGNKYEGTWKNNNSVKGTITYTNGDRYDGECSYDKKTQLLKRNGQGTLVSANGETTSGKWKDDEYISKK